MKPEVTQRSRPTKPTLTIHNLDSKNSTAMQPRNPDYQQEKIQIITRKKNKEIKIESEEPTRKVEVLRNPRRVCSHRESHEHWDHRNPQCPWACETRSWRLRSRTIARSESPPESDTCSTCKLSPGSTSLRCLRDPNGVLALRSWSFWEWGFVVCGFLINVGGFLCVLIGEWDAFKRGVSFT